MFEHFKASTDSDDFLTPGHQVARAIRTQLGEPLQAITAAREAIERDQEEITLTLQAMGAPVALDTGVLARLAKAEKTVREIAEDWNELGAWLEDLDFSVAGTHGESVPVSRHDAAPVNHRDFQAEAAKACQEHPRDMWGGLQVRTNLDQALERWGGIVQER